MAAQNAEQPLTRAEEACLIILGALAERGVKPTTQGVAVALEAVFKIKMTEEEVHGALAALESRGFAARGDG
jgi:hypothetical protein